MYNIGDVVSLEGAFTNQSGNAVDPGQVGFKIKSPTGTITTYTYPADAQIIRDSTGNYHVNWEPDRAGIWVWRFEGLVSNKAAEEQTFIVRASGV